MLPQSCDRKREHYVRFPKAAPHMTKSPASEHPFLTKLQDFEASLCPEPRGDHGGALRVGSECTHWDWNSSKTVDPGLFGFRTYHRARLLLRHPGKWFLLL